MANNIVTLRRRSDFLDLTKTGRRIQLAPWLVINYKLNGLDHPRFGWTIPTSVGQAVVRNRLRRWCREVVRKSLNEYENYDINLFFRARDGFDAKKLTFQNLEARLQTGTKPLRKKLIKNA